MYNVKIVTRNIALAGAVTFLLGSTAFAQGYPQGNPRSNEQGGYSRGYANRTVDGTVASVEHARRGDHVRLTNGMDLLVPNSIVIVNEGRRYGAANLQPGDVVRMQVYSREGDGRDAQVRSLELVDRAWVFNNNDRTLNGTVVSYDRRANVLVMQTVNGRMLNVQVNGRGYGRGNNMFRRGQSITVTGRMNGFVVVADDVSISTTTYDRRH